MKTPVHETNLHLLLIGITLAGSVPLSAQAPSAPAHYGGYARYGGGSGYASGWRGTAEWGGGSGSAHGYRGGSASWSGGSGSATGWRGNSVSGISHLNQLNRIMKHLLSIVRLTGCLLVLAPGAHAQEASSGEAAQLAKQLSNPVASLISVPFQANYDFNMGPTDHGSKFTLNIQPVIPISIGKDWNLIVRTILPVISQHDVFYRDIPSFPGLPDRILNQVPPALRDDAEREARQLYDEEVRRHPQNRSQDGLGDTTQSFFFSPKEPGPGGLIWGIGPALLYPTATQDLLGGGKWGAGPTFVALVQKGGWTVGALANQIWSFAGDDDRNNISSMFLQPFAAYTTRTHTTFTLNTESTYDWENSQWTVPINVMVSQILKIGKQPISIQIGGRYYTEGPSGAPDWGVRLNITLLYPTGKHELAHHDGKSFSK